MELSFPRYLLSKQTVDDRALNRSVLEALKSALATTPSITIIEVGAGIGTMLARLLRWGILPATVQYTILDEMPENITFARTWLPQWACDNGWAVEQLPEDAIRLTHPAQPGPASVTIRFTCADIFDYIRFSASKSVPASADLLIANAFLDLLPMPASLPKLFSLLKPGGLAWFTINFDGVTTLEPPIRFSAPESDTDSASIDTLIECLYHQSMDSRPTGGDSQSGRHLFRYLKQAGAGLISAGASDWVVYPLQGQYPADEAYFLHFILYFFEQSLANHPQLDPQTFAAWLAARRAQVDRAELVYIAHQMDFLVTAPDDPKNNVL